MSESSTHEQSLERVFRLAEEAMAERQEQIADGQNDYNLLTAVLKKHDEVRLHSRFLYSMLNHQGAHYFGTDFLEKFLDTVLKQTCNLEDVKVFKEWNDGEENGGIDLFITDGYKFFIIENKIHAGDQHRQIARYVATVKKKFNLDAAHVAENVFVYYLSPHARKPSKNSLGGFSLAAKDALEYSCTNTDALKGKSKTLEDSLNKCLDGITIQYANITYQHHIIAWIEDCLKVTKLRDNLKDAFTTYKDVVNRVLNNRESAIMNIETKLLENKNASLLSQAREIEKAMIKVKGSILHDFFESVKTEFCDYKLLEPDAWKKSEPFKQFNSENCRKWFNKTQTNRKYIGVIFEVSPDIHVGIIAASEHIHAGILATPINLLDNNPVIKVTDSITLTKRKWSNCPPWYSVEIVKDAFQFSEEPIKLLIAEDKISTDQLFSTLRNIIDFAQLLAGKTTSPT